MATVAAWVIRHPKAVMAGLGLAVFFGLGLQIRSLRGELAESRREVRAVGLRADSLAAELDTTRLVAGQFRRRAVQTEIERDSLAVALEERPVVETTVTLDPEPVVDTVEVAFNDSTLHSKFEDETLIAEVTFRQVPEARWRAEWTVDIKPIALSVGVRCGPVSQTTGVRPVQVTVEAELTEVDITESRADPEVCNPEPPDKSGGGFLKGVLSGVALALTVITLR